MGHPFSPLCGLWIEKLERARKHKREVFQDDADRAQSFFDGPKDWDELMGIKGFVENVPCPDFKISVNKAFELVTTFGPNLYHDNPTRTITPRQPLDIPPELFPDPQLLMSLQQQQALENLQDEFRAALLSQYLNLTPNELDLRANARAAIDEALIKGRGCLWTELYSPPNANFRMVGSFADSVDNLFVDPDACCFGKAKWIARRCCHPVWEVEREYGLPPGTIRGTHESYESISDNPESDDTLYFRRKGESNDLLVYWKVYTKMGMGGRLSGGMSGALRKTLEYFPEHCYLVIAQSVPYPLNLPPQAMQLPMDQIVKMVDWPIPYYQIDQWPVSELDFHVTQNVCWPTSHLKPAFGELRFINWAMSFLAGKVRTTSRDFIACLKSASEEIKTAILENRDLQLLEITSDHKSIAEVVQFLQHPGMNSDIWQVIADLERKFEQRTGLNELTLGSAPSKQIRSAEEAASRNNAAAVRPDDMAKNVEAWMSRVAKKEAFASALMLGNKDIEPILGPIGASFWVSYVTTADINFQGRRFDCRIESGSSRKPNKDQQVSNMTEGLQVIMPVLQAYAGASGDWLPVNNLISEWAKSRDLVPGRFALAPTPPPAQNVPAPVGPGGGGTGEPPPG